AGAAQGLRPDGRAALGHLHGQLRQRRRLLSLLLRRGARLRPHRAGGCLCPGLPADRRGARLRRAAATEKNPAHQYNRAMSTSIERLEARLRERFGDAAELSRGPAGELTLEVLPAGLVEAATVLRDADGLEFAMLVDVAGVDYLASGMDEWRTVKATETGFSRGVARGSPPVSPDTPRRFAAAYHLLSLSMNQRLRVRCYPEPGDPPRLPTVT